MRIVVASKINFRGKKNESKYTEGFKVQSVEKALNRSSEISQIEMANTLGISLSTLQRWITQFKNPYLERSSLPHKQLRKMTVRKSVDTSVYGFLVPSA